MSFTAATLIFLVVCVLVLRYAVPSTVGKIVLGVAFLTDYVVISMMYFDSLK